MFRFLFVVVFISYSSSPFSVLHLLSRPYRSASRSVATPSQMGGAARISKSIHQRFPLFYETLFPPTLPREYRYDLFCSCRWSSARCYRASVCETVPRYCIRLRSLSSIHIQWSSDCCVFHIPAAMEKVPKPFAVSFLNKILIGFHSVLINFFEWRIRYLVTTVLFIDSFPVLHFC